VVNGALWLVAAITLQATLGILTLLNQVPIDLALAHQAVAIAVLTSAVFQAERLAARQPRLANRSWSEIFWRGGPGDARAGP
jgi:cytochrome c oxidase assembly protein subunit 15